MLNTTAIKDLAIISDRHTCGILDQSGNIVWYCPDRFDNSAIFSSLLDKEKGGYWQVKAEDKQFLSRQFDGRSSILRNYYAVPEGGFTITDFMPLSDQVKGIVRFFSASPVKIVNEIKFIADYGLETVEYVRINHNTIRLENMGLYLSSSHPIEIIGDAIRLIAITIPTDETAWIYLGNQKEVTEELLTQQHDETLQAWKEIESLVNYHGPYENQVRYSLRALQQMVYEPSGGIIAAATTSLPEVIGGERNYDYRYVWMRDAALITSSLTQIITNGALEDKFMSFIAEAMEKNQEDHISCFYTIDKIRPDSKIRKLPLSGYLDSKPVQIGNGAADQFQLDAEGNVLISLSLIYQKLGKVSHWETANRIADFICKNWENKDNGIWEEEQQQHYTSSKAFAARGLELIASYQPDRELAERWLKNARLIREYIAENCITTSGAYAVHAGSDDVDIAAALFVPFGFDDAKSPAMLATIAELEKNYSENNLYRRHLMEFDSAKEGVFLAGSCWMAHYYAIAGNLLQSKQIIDAVLACGNDLGYFAEEADVKKEIMLGNFPQTFVHSSFICAVNGYKLALSGQESVVRKAK